MRTCLLLACIAGAISVCAQAPNDCTKTAYADIEYIFSRLPAAKQIEVELKSTQAQLQHQISAKEQELQKKYTEFTQKEKTMLDAVRENTRRELQLLNDNLEKFKQEAQSMLEGKQQQLIGPVYQNIAKAIEDVATSENISFVLTPNANGVNVMLYADKKNNISDAVLKKLGVTTAPDAGNTR